MAERRIKPRVLTDREVNELLVQCTNITYKFAAVLLVDCGPRISELVILRISNFNFPKRILTIRTLKQGKVKTGEKKGENKEVYRQIHMSDRVMKIGAKFFVRFKDHNPDTLIFQSPMTDSNIHRQYFWRYLDHVSNHYVTPHTLRRTFATNMYEATKDLLVVRDSLGHKQISTSNIYLKSTEEKQRSAMLQVQKHREGQMITLARKYFPEAFRIKNAHVFPLPGLMTKYHVGRKTELALIHELAEKKVNTLLIGEQGTGKSHLLDNLNFVKMLRVDDTKDFKKTLASMCLQILDDAKAKGEPIQTLKLNRRRHDFKTAMTDDKLDTEERSADWELNSYPTDDKEMLLQMLGAKREVITTYSAKRLCELLIQLTEKNEYTIIIDSADNVTPSVVSSLEFLRNHFHFVVAARKIKLEVGTWLTNFQRVKIDVLNRTETIELIIRASEKFRANIEDFDLYKNHIIQKAGGNPQFTLELIERFSKETFVSKSMVNTIDYMNQNKRELSMTPFILIALGLGFVAKYWSREASPVDYPAFAIIAAICIVVAMFGRGLRMPMRRKYF